MNDKWWSAVFGAVMFACGALFVVAPIVGWWMPHGVAEHTYDVDFLFYLILGITGFFYVLTEGILVYNMFRFDGQPGRKAPFIHGSHRLEVLWTAAGLATAFDSRSSCLSGTCNSGCTGAGPCAG